VAPKENQGLKRQAFLTGKQIDKNKELIKNKLVVALKEKMMRQIIKRKKMTMKVQKIDHLASR
jgi:hypothetical protein